MQTQFYEQTCRAEDRHWWFQSRLELVAEYLEKMALPADARILDCQGKTRYRLADFRRYFPQAGLTFEGGRYFNAAAFPVCLAAAVGHRLLGRADDGNGEVTDLAFPPRIINRALMFYLAMERRFSRWVPLPVGVTLLAMGRKPVAAPGRADEVTNAPARHQDNVLADGWTEPRPQHEPGTASPAIHCHSDS